MKIFNRIAIVGVGLIGGSLALAIKKKKLAGKIIGVSRHKRTLLEAKKIGAIDEGSLDSKAVKDADLIIFATPVETILELAGQIFRLAKKDCLVTDVGSTKEAIVSKLEKLFPNFIGSHPLAGSEKRGIVNANAKIFQDSLCILTPTRKTNPKVKQKIEAFWKRLGARTVFLSPREHDRIISFTSHLPHIAAFSLISAIPRKFLKFAAGSLKDTTRIAASDSNLWVEIFLSNRNSLEGIKVFKENLASIEQAILRKDKKALSRILKAAKLKREILR